MELCRVRHLQITILSLVSVDGLYAHGHHVVAIERRELGRGEVFSIRVANARHDEEDGGVRPSAFERLKGGLQPAVERLSLAAVQRGFGLAARLALTVAAAMELGHHFSVHVDEVGVVEAGLRVVAPQSLDAVVKDVGHSELAGVAQ